MNILITGGSGFIGKNLTEFLSKKHTVLSPSHCDLELLDEDAVRSYLNKCRVDIIIHGAVRPGHRNAKDSSEQLYCNTRMFFNLLRNSNRFTKMLYLGSGLEYDLRHYAPKMKEEYFDTHVPIDEGGFSKYIISKYIERADNVVELRIFGIFGKYEDYAIRFISNAICKTLFDLPITIKQNRKFDYIYIEDIMQIIDYFIENKPEYKVYNLTPDKSTELYELAEKVRETSGKNLPIKKHNDGMGVEYSGDNARLRKEIPYIKFMPIADAIEELYKWYSKNMHLINKEYLLEDK